MVTCFYENLVMYLLVVSALRKRFNIIINSSIASCLWHYGAFITKVKGTTKPQAKAVLPFCGSKGLIGAQHRYKNSIE